MSRFLEADKQAAQKRKPIQCRLCRYLTELPKHEATELRGLLATRGASHMVNVLDKCGFTVAKSSVQNHQAKHSDTV